MYGDVSFHSHLRSGAPCTTAHDPILLSSTLLYRFPSGIGAFGSFWSSTEYMASCNPCSNVAGPPGGVCRGFSDRPEPLQGSTAV